jgi:hypothetical protein
MPQTAYGPDETLHDEDEFVSCGLGSSRQFAAWSRTLAVGVEPA